MVKDIYNQNFLIMRTKRTYKDINSLKGKVNQLNLYNLLSKSIYLDGAGWIKTNNLLTDELIENVCELLGGHYATRNKMATVLKNQVFSKWYLERIIYSFKRNRFEYIAGQDYPAELAEIRKDLVKRY